MTKSTILSVIAAVTMLPAAVAQEPAPAPTVPEGVMVTTRAFINGKEVPPAKAAEMMNSMRAQFRRQLLGEEPTAEAVPAPELPPPGAAPELTPPPPGLEPPPAQPTPAAEPAPAPAPVAESPAPPAAEPAPAPEVQPAPAPAAEPVAVKAEVIKPACGKVRLIVNGKEVRPDVVRVVPAPVPGQKPICRPQPVRKAHPARHAAPASAAQPAAAADKPICPRCGKVRRVVRPAAGDMPPCGKARPFDAPAYGTTPPCVRRHGQTMNPSVRMHTVRPAIDIRKAPQPATSPQAVRVIINGVETIVPLKPEGVDITIKPL